MKFSRFALLSAALFLSVAASHAQEKPAEKPEVAAQKSAETWLTLIDSARYADSYDQAADELKAQVTKPQWIQNFTSARGGAGAFKSRKLLNSIYTENIPNAPAGKYVVLQYEAKFDAGSSTEQVVSILEKDGSWREVGYVMSPPQ